MARERKLSMTQLMAGAWTAALAAATESLPGLAGAGRAGWLWPLPAGLVLLALGWLLGRIGEGGLKGAFGPVWGRGLCILYIVWGGALLGQCLERCARRLSGMGEREGGFLFFLPALAALALWMAGGGGAAFGRTAQGLLASLLAAAGTVLLLALPGVDWTLMLPIRAEEWSGLPELAWWGAGAMAPAAYAAFLLGDADRERAGPAFLGWVCGGGVLLTAAMGVVQGCLGPALCARLPDPLFTLAQGVGVEGGFQRLESVLRMIWTGADLGMCVILLLAIERLWDELGTKVRGEWGQTVTLVLAAAVAAAGLPGEKLGQITLLLLAIPAAVAALIGKGDRRKKERGHILWRKGDEKRKI